MKTTNAPMITEVCAYCRLRKAEADPKRCGYRKVRPGTDPHRFEMIEMDPRIAEVATAVAGDAFEGTFWYGADFYNLRLVTEFAGGEDSIELIVFDDDDLNIPSYKITFAGAPTSVIIQTVAAI
jgi:hypothetical protein